MEKKQYIIPVYRVIKTEAATMLATSPSKTTDVTVDNNPSEEFVEGDVNKNDFQDILW